MVLTNGEIKELCDDSGTTIPWVPTVEGRAGAIVDILRVAAGKSISRSWNDGDESYDMKMLVKLSLNSGLPNPLLPSGNSEVVGYPRDGQSNMSYGAYPIGMPIILPLASVVVFAIGLIDSSYVAI